MFRRHSIPLIAGAVLSLAIASPAMSHEKGAYGQYSAGPCPGMMGHMMGQMSQGGMMGQRGMMEPGMGHHGMMGPGRGRGMGMMGSGMGQQGQGMMGHGMGQDGPRTMGPGMDQRGMMGPGMGYHGMMGRGMGPGGYLDRDLSTDDVKAILEHRLEHHGNDRLRVGTVEAQGDDLIVAEVETVDGSLVERLEVDRHTGRARRVQ